MKPLKIIKLEASNLKRLVAVEITPDGNIVEITGANSQGKSSVLDSIFYALAGTSGIPSQPIRRGEQKATVRLDLGEIVVRREFTASGTKLYVESQNGARFPSPQKMLDELLGSLSFDPLAFSRMPAKLQLETLRRLVPLDVDVDELDGLNTRDYEARTDVNRRMRMLEGRADMLAAQVDKSMNCELTDISEIIDQLDAAHNHNAQIERNRRELAIARNTIADRREQSLKLRTEAERMLERAARMEAMADADEKQLTVMESENNEDLADLSLLRDTIERETKLNQAREAQARVRTEHQATVDKLTAAKLQSDNLTLAMNDRAAQKADAIARAKMPVEGLSFGDGEVLYQGVPFSQASSAEQTRVSCALAMAMNPKLRVVLIKDGSLLDDASMVIVAQMAAANDTQVWIERVSNDGKVGIVIEDGRIASVNGVPVESEAEVAEAV